MNPNCLYAEPWVPRVAAVQGEAANHYTNNAGVVHCVASANMLAGGGGCGSTVSAFPDADLFTTHAAASLTIPSLFLLGEYTIKYYLN